MGYGLKPSFADHWSVTFKTEAMSYILMPPGSSIVPGILRGSQQAVVE